MAPEMCLGTWFIRDEVQVSPKISSLATAAAPLFTKLRLVDARVANAYLLLAARGGVMGAAAKVAQKYASGQGMEPNAAEACWWYETVLQVRLVWP